MAQPKKVPISIIPEVLENGTANPLHAQMAELIRLHHLPDLAEARVQLWWKKGWKPSRSDKITLGMAYKCNDRDRLAAGYDFHIYLNHEWWNSPLTTDAQRAAVLDHELMHCRAVIDPETQDFSRDENGQVVYYIKQHDIEEFRSIVERHGIYKQDIEAFYAALLIGNGNATRRTPTPAISPPTAGT